MIPSTLLPLDPASINIRPASSAIIAIGSSGGNEGWGTE
jgi:hypothetical protein